MTRRRVNMALHWALVFVLFAMLNGSAGDPRFQCALVGVGGLWAVIAMFYGVRAKPGPELSGAARTYYRLIHGLLYLCIASTAALHVAALSGWISTGPAWIALLILFGAGMFHALFQMWRHTALYDGALRMMTPKIWHKYL